MLHPKRFRALAGVIVIFAILGATLFVPAATAAAVKVTLEISPKGVSNGDFNLLTTFPLTVTFTVKSGSAGLTLFWQFGDGSSGTDAAPTHTYTQPCVYDVKVRAKAGNGSVASGELVLGAFGARGRLGALAVCPTQGTAGFVPVELAGGYFSAYRKVNVTMNGARMATVTADKGGDWILNVTGFLTPEPNGTQYAFATSPVSLTRAFTTLEGIRALPASGAPGGSVLVEGRSYLPYSSVLVWLGNANLGTEQTNDSGSFQATLQVPFAYPLIVAGTYQYTTFPPILGSHASFKSTGALETALSLWWVWPLLIILVLVLAYLLWRRRRRRAASDLGPEP